MPCLSQRFNRFLTTLNTRNLFVGGRTGCRRIGERNFTTAASRHVEARRHSVPHVQETRREMCSPGTGSLNNQEYTAKILYLQNTYRFVNVLKQFVKVYNKKVHRALDMAPASVTGKQAVDICNHMNERRSRVRVGRVKFIVGQHVRISKKNEIRKGVGTELYLQEIYNLTVIFRTARAVYELEDLNGTLMEGKFYGEELTPDRVTKHSVYEINKILYIRYRYSILEYLVHWIGYRKDFDSWGPAVSVKNI